MKKKYIAPDLYFESFRLSQSIAAGCSSDGVAAVKMWHELDGSYFLDDRASMDCGVHIETAEELKVLLGEAYCYWDGTDMKIFTS